MFMVPAIAILILFLAYPLALGFWLGMTDTKIGGAGRYIGFAELRFAREGSVFWLSVFNTIFYTVVASIVKFAHRPLSRAAAQRAAADEVDDPRDRAVAVRRADGAVGDRVLVDL